MKKLFLKYVFMYIKDYGKQTLIPPFPRITSQLHK